MLDRITRQSHLTGAMPFDSCTATQAALKERKPTPYNEAVELQDIALRDCRDAKTPPHIRAALMRAWCDLEERKRILRMKPLPKSVDVSYRKPAKRPRNVVAFTEDSDSRATKPNATKSETPTKPGNSAGQ